MTGDCIPDGKEHPDGILYPVGRKTYCCDAVVVVVAVPDCVEVP
jgi:hypothetical protein